MKKLKVNLCEKCVNDLNHYNPYTLSIDELDINVVPEEKCENYTENGVFVNMKGE